ncbi:MAG: aminoacyl-tRNA hydrolase [Thermodesulfobacteriota bacterium]|nr:aminoacyl-tRNA hydrolase [Thermodesulfobacteriota bacterium]
MYLIAGLGNPGPKYRNTRHNAGYKVINQWCQSMDIRLKGRRFQSRNTRMKFGEKEVILLRPTTFMNQSGRSIEACVDFFGITTKNILIIHDDIDLPVGRIKAVRNGGAGGHRGVLSIIQQLGSNEFHRIKIGIGRPSHGETIEDYVLSPFYGDEKDIKEKVIQIGVWACELFVSGGIDTAMNNVNCYNLKK